MCETCSKVPSSHSFRKLNYDEKHAWFYSLDSEASDKDSDRIKSHILNELEWYHTTFPEGKWSWVFDSKDYEFNMNSMNIFLVFVDILKIYKGTLQKIRIVNPNDTIRSMFPTLVKMLPDRVSEILEIRE